MKKTIMLTISFICAICIFCTGFAYANTSTAVTNTSKEPISDKTKSELVTLKDNELKSIEDYQKAYGSATYGTVAYILNKVRIYSIPFAFLGIAISAIYQYVLGVRNLETQDKGFNAMIAIVTLFVICQVLPLVFAIVVKGWRE
jgi:hypothetical protein